MVERGHGTSWSPRNRVRPIEKPAMTVLTRRRPCAETLRQQPSTTINDCSSGARLGRPDVHGGASVATRVGVRRGRRPGVIARRRDRCHTGERDGRLALCASPTCRAAFFDTSRSRTRSGATRTRVAIARRRPASWPTTARTPTADRRHPRSGDDDVIANSRFASPTVVPPLDANPERAASRRRSDHQTPVAIRMSATTPRRRRPR